MVSIVSVFCGYRTGAMCPGVRRKLLNQTEFLILNWKGYLFSVLLDVRDCITYSRNLLSLIVWDADSERLLKLHDELYSVKRVCSEVVSETCLWLNFCFVNSEFVNDD